MLNLTSLCYITFPISVPSFPELLSIKSTDRKKLLSLSLSLSLSLISAPKDAESRQTECSMVFHGAFKRIPHPL